MDGSRIVAFAWPGGLRGRGVGPPFGRSANETDRLQPIPLPPRYGQREAVGYASPAPAARPRTSSGRAVLFPGGGCLLARPEGAAGRADWGDCRAEKGQTQAKSN